MENLKLFAYGGISSVAAEIVTFPLDVTKTRLQIQQGRNVQYKSFIDCGKQIFKTEGYKGLYGGISAAVLRQVCYGSLKFGTYYTMKNFFVSKFYHDEHGNENLFINVSCAAFSGAFSSAIANPTDVLKVRLQIKGNDIPLHKCFYEIYYTEGLKGCYRGVVQTSQRAATIAGNCFVIELELIYLHIICFSIF